MRSNVLRQILPLIEDSEHDGLVKKSDDMADFMELVRKKMLAYQALFKRSDHSPFAAHLAELAGELARILRQATVDVEKSAALLEPDL